jgi:hypothetical protein
VRKGYQTPYGEVPVERHVYQSSADGALDRDARIVRKATPRFASMCAWRMACMNSPEAVEDLLRNNGRKIARSYFQNIASDVALIAWEKESVWSYEVPNLPREVATVSLGIDGTCVLFCEGGYGQAMVGTIALNTPAPNGSTPSTPPPPLSAAPARSGERPRSSVLVSPQRQEFLLQGLAAPVPSTPKRNLQVSKILNRQAG